MPLKLPANSLDSGSQEDDGQSAPDESSKETTNTSIGRDSKLSASLTGNGVASPVEGESYANGKPSLAKPLGSPGGKQLPLHNSEQQKSHKDKETESRKTNSSRKDKTKLRKGKWTVEEEEYTSRIIHHFSTGVLTLPEGSTLRSYLADRLNCDPMRITKKFTGACCLGRRVYHLRDRPRASPADVAMAKAELAHLEQRFRMRVEQEQTGMPLARGQEIFLAQRQNVVGTIFPVQNPSPASLLHPWGQAYPDMNPSSALSLALSAVNRPIQATLSGQFPLASLSPASNPFLLPTASNTIPPTSTLATIPQNDGSIHLLNNLVNSLAWAQAKASISPAVAVLQQQQKTQNEEHQRQLRTAYEEQKKEQDQRQLLERKLEDVQSARGAQADRSSTIAQKEGPPDADFSTKRQPDISPAQQLQLSYEAHLESLKKSSIDQHAVVDEVCTVQTSQDDDETTQSSKSMTTLLRNDKGGKSLQDDERVESKAGKEISRDADGDEKNDYKEAGTILLGFMNSLRQSYEDAVEETETAPVGMVQKPKPQEKKRTREVDDAMVHPTSTPFQSQSQSRRRPAYVTDTSTLSRSETSSGTSSQPTESSSSIEDSDSKSDKTEPSSSEESEKDYPLNQRKKKGPPRKRLKTNKMVKEITAQNLAEHSKRMSEEFRAENGNSF